MKKHAWRGRPWKDGDKRPPDETCVDDEGLLRRLQAADPAGDQGLGDWAGSDAGRQLYERILERRQEPEPERSRKPRASRLVLVAGAAVVVAAAVVLGLVLGLGGSAQVASTSSTGTVVQKPVDRVEVLAQLVSDAKAGVPGTERPAMGDWESGVAAEGQILGIIGASDLAWAAERGSLSRATYCLWVWRAFRDRLKQGEEVNFTDLGTLSEEVRSAVLGVAGAGILDGKAEGLFEPNADLSKQDAQESLRRLQLALGLQVR